MLTVVIGGILMIIYEIANFAEGFIDEIPLRYYKIFHVLAYVITILMGVSFVVCDEEQNILRILIAFCGLFWLIRCIVDWLTYVGMEQEAIEAIKNMKNDEKKDE